MVVDFQGIWKLLNLSAFAETLSSCDVWKFPLDWNRWNRNDIAKIMGKQFGIFKITEIAFQIVVSSGKKHGHIEIQGPFLWTLAFNERLPWTKHEKKTNDVNSFKLRCRHRGTPALPLREIYAVQFLLRLAAKLIDILRVLSLGFVFLGDWGSISG